MVSYFTRKISARENSTYDYVLLWKIYAGCIYRERNPVGLGRSFRSKLFIKCLYKCSIRLKYFILFTTTVLFKWILLAIVLTFLLCELFSEHWRISGGEKLSSEFERNLQQSVGWHRFDYDSWWRYNIRIGKRVQLFRFIAGTISSKLFMLNLMFANNCEAVFRIVRSWWLG